MGFLDFLFDKEKAEQRRLAKLEKTLTHMYVQPQERSYAIQQLRDKENEAAVRVLLTRFDESAPNTTVDLEEKEYVYDTLVEMGRSPNVDVVGVISDHLRKAEENVNWPIKVLTDLLTLDEFVTFLTDLLHDCDLEFVRDPQKKQELVLRAAEFEDEELARELLRFLDDPDEGVRFLTVESLLKMGFDDLTEEPLRELLKDEDSIRIVRKLVDAFVDKKWEIPEDEQEEVEAALPDGYSVHKNGYIYERR